ncbi:hypothetical protein CCR84_11085 [Rhodocyclus purpureus]|nr:hypothetical protein [Rhodocyclus purpureus]
MERSRLVIAVIDRNAPSAELVAQLLRRFQISVLICDTGAGFMPIHRFIKDILESRCALLTSKPVTNQSERWLLSVTDLGLGRRSPERIKSTIPPQLIGVFEAHWARSRKKFLVFHEAALSAFIDFTLAKADPDIDLNFALNSRVDVLVTGEAPDYLPLLAIEFDGPHHRTEDGKRKDKKKESIFRKADIPLLRVGFEDAPPRNEDSQIVDISVRRKAVAKEAFLIQLIGSVARKLQRERVGYRQRRASYWDHLGKEYKTLEAITLKKMGLTVLSEEARLRLLEDVMENLDDLHQEVIDGIALDDYLDRQDRDELLDPERRPELKKHGVYIRDFAWRKDCEGGVYCQATLERDGTSRAVRTSSVQFTTFGSTDMAFDAVLNEELKIWLIDNVCHSIATSNEPSVTKRT